MRYDTRKHPPGGQQSCRVLLPRVVGSCREWQKCWRGCLTVRDLPACAQGPFVLEEVWPGDGAQWRPGQASCRMREICGEATVPLICIVRDRDGCRHTGTACLSLETCVRMFGPADSSWGCQWMVRPCVRMACLPVCASQPVFEVELDVLLEVDCVRWQTFACGREEKTCCPDLPLYPPPCR